MVDVADNIQVCVRMRPLVKEEYDVNDDIVWNWSDNTIIHNVNKWVGPYTFDHVFYPTDTNQHIFENVVKRVVHAAMKGFHGSVFSYGQTSSGKTFTMNGGQSQPGIIPQAIYECFEAVHSFPNREFLLRVSYLEVYNEQIKDLLSTEPVNIKLQHDPKLGTVITGHKEQVVLSPEQVISLIRAGEAQRHIGSTDMNEKSSRAHTIFRLVIESKELVAKSTTPAKKSAPVKVSVLNLIDLAGSESAKLTNSKGDRAREAKFINQSLLTLSTIIQRLSEDRATQNLGRKAQHLPYRDSKLTRILESSLDGSAFISIICTISPASRCCDETINTLKFASRAKLIKTSAKVNEVVDDKTLLRVYREEIEQLRAKLEAFEREQKVAGSSKGTSDVTSKTRRRHAAERRVGEDNDGKEGIKGQNGSKEDDSDSDYSSSGSDHDSDDSTGTDYSGEEVVELLEDDGHDDISLIAGGAVATAPTVFRPFLDTEDDSDLMKVGGDASKDFSGGYSLNRNSKVLSGPVKKQPNKRQSRSSSKGTKHSHKEKNNDGEDQEYILQMIAEMERLILKADKSRADSGHHVANKASSSAGATSSAGIVLDGDNEGGLSGQVPQYLAVLKRSNSVEQGAIVTGRDMDDAHPLIVNHISPTAAVGGGDKRFLVPEIHSGNTEQAGIGEDEIEVLAAPASKTPATEMVSSSSSVKSKVQALNQSTNKYMMSGAKTSTTPLSKISSSSGKSASATKSSESSAVKAPPNPFCNESPLSSAKKESAVKSVTDEEASTHSGNKPANPFRVNAFGNPISTTSTAGTATVAKKSLLKTPMKSSVASAAASKMKTTTSTASESITGTTSNCLEINGNGHPSSTNVHGGTDSNVLEESSTASRLSAAIIPLAIAAPSSGSTGNVYESTRADNLTKTDISGLEGKMVIRADLVISTANSSATDKDRQAPIDGALDNQALQDDDTAALSNVSHMLAVLKQHVSKSKQKQSQAHLGVETATMMPSLQGNGFNSSPAHSHTIPPLMLGASSTGSNSGSSSPVKSSGHNSFDIDHSLIHHSNSFSGTGIVNSARTSVPSTNHHHALAVIDQLKLDLRLKEADNRFLQDDLAEKDQMLAVVTEGLKEVEITHTQLLNTNQELSSELERVLTENKLLKKQINKLKIYLELNQISMEKVIQAEHTHVETAL